MEKNVCVICESGWIIKGEKVDSDDASLTLKNASVVRCWSNGRGIGGIAKAEYKDEYTLDYIGDVYISSGKILFIIPCEW
jgi:hypothetical protein